MPKKTPVPEAPDQTPCNCLALRQAARRLSQIYDGHLVPEGLRTTQYSILSKLNRLGPLPIGKPSCNRFPYHRLSRFSLK